MELNIHNVLTKLGIKSSDTIVIHGDAGAAFQLKEIDIPKRLNYFLNQLIEYIDTSGTLVVPSFSYSFTKNEEFDVQKTPSDIGLFSEAFRLLPNVSRSKNPNFSVCSIGKFSNEFSNSRIDDCFGEGSAFELMYKYNAKIICLGCDFSRITFVHYMEQKIGVSYRYFKRFSGSIVDLGNKQFIDNTYYVRDLNIESQGELSAVKNSANEKGLLGIEKFGRFPVFSICAKDFYNTAEELLSKNPYALIQHRLNLK